MLAAAAEQWGEDEQIPLGVACSFKYNETGSCF